MFLLNLLKFCGFALVIFILVKIICSFFEKKNNIFDTYFGVPGSGKTTFAAWLAKKNFKKKRNVYSNVPIIGAMEIDKSDFGKYQIEKGIVLFDEAGIDLDNRNFSSNFNKQQVSFLKKHRHYDVDMVFFSQYWNDIDIKIRNLSTRLFLVQKSIFPFCISRKRIGKRIGIDDMTKQIIDEYYFVKFSRKIIFAPKLWKFFNSYDKEQFEHKDFPIYKSTVSRDCGRDTVV